MTQESRPRVLVLTFTPVNREPRALKQIDLFSEKYAVTSAGFGPAPRKHVPHIELTETTPHSGSKPARVRYLLLLAFRLHRLMFRFSKRDTSALKLLSQEKWDLIIAHDVLTVGLANRLNPRYGVLADLHEYAPRQNEHSAAWRALIAPYFRWICRTELSKVAAVTTVGQGIVDEYRKRFGIEAELVVNATPYRQLDVEKVPSTIRLVHSGIPAPARKLEIMVEAVRDTPADVTLDLYLTDAGSSYYKHLQSLAGDSNRIRFRDAVPYSELIETLNQYDVGVSIIAPTTFNLTWCLPNKFFDFIQARLGVIIGPSPEMTRFVEQYGIGAVARDFTASSFSELLTELTPETVEGWKSNSARHSRELSSEEQVKVWARLAHDILSDDTASSNR